MADIAEAGGRETVRIVSDAGGTAEFVGHDIAVSRDVERAVSRVIERFGRLDAAVNAAAIEIEQTKLADCDEDVFDRLVAVNLKSCS